MSTIFCPNCGSEIKNIKFDGIYKNLPPSAEISCPECEMTLFIEDRSSTDQEGFIEIVFH